jgi:DnaJ-class molecular chaperone
LGIANRAYNLLRAYIGREWERIEGVWERDARAELEAATSSETPTPPPFQPKVESDIERSYSVLGLSKDAGVADLRQAYKRLSERSLPSNFPEGSEERRMAADIHVRVQEAYDVLLPVLDNRIRRFQTLDLD